MCVGLLAKNLFGLNTQVVLKPVATPGLKDSGGQVPKRHSLRYQRSDTERSFNTREADARGKRDEGLGIEPKAHFPNLPP